MQDDNRITRFSKLQSSILDWLAKHPKGNTVEIAKAMDFLYPSVSRSLKLLKSKGMVRNSQGWQITDVGTEKLSSEFRPANDISWQWGDLMISFDCICGDEIILSNEDNLQNCECGREYRFTTFIEVKGITGGNQ